MSARYIGPKRRRSVGQWIWPVVYYLGLPLAGFAYLVVLIAALAVLGDEMGALAVVLAMPAPRPSLIGRLLERIVHRFRADVATAAGTPDEDPVPTLSESLERLAQMQAQVDRMIAVAPPRPRDARTRAGDPPAARESQP